MKRKLTPFIDQVTHAGHPLYRFVGAGSHAISAGGKALSPARKKVETDG
jgi:hypothetical protein